MLDNEYVYIDSESLPLIEDDSSETPHDQTDLNVLNVRPKREYTKYHQYLTRVISESKKFSHHALINSSEVVQQAFMKMFDKPTLSAALVKLPKVINDISKKDWLPKSFVESSFPMAALDYRMHKPKEEKHGEKISTMMEQFKCPETTPESLQFTECFNALQTFVQKSIEHETCLSSSMIPTKMTGAALRLKKPKISVPMNLTHFMVKMSSVSPFCSERRAYNIASVVNAYQINGVIRSPQIVDDETVNNAKEMGDKKMKKEKKIPKSRKSSKYSRKSKKCQGRHRRPSQSKKPKKKYDPNGSQNPVCLEESVVRGERATIADIQSLKTRKLKPETARVKPAIPFTTAFCDTPWFRRQLKNGEHSKPISLVEQRGRSRTTGEKRTLLEKKFNEKAALCVHQPIPIPICLQSIPVATPWKDKYPDNYDEYFEAYKQYVVESHKNYGIKEEDNWKDYNTELLKQSENPYNEYEVMQHLNLDKKNIISSSQECRENDKNLANLLQNSSVQSE
uniref:Uncharacterized protein n=1 Tax=Panagrolaimus sp. PS1159 TaxID=55785 RepID=A0AC35GBW5_9BILA